VNLLWNNLVKHKH